MIEVGLCGYSMAQSAYARMFSVVEVQHTFYEPPSATTLTRWRAMMPPTFEFTIKAWQLITHSSASPTYRRLKRVLRATERSEAGSFRDTPIVDEAWRTTLDCAARLQATAILFQCPASFRPTSENVRNLRRFFGRISRPAGVQLMLEPRGPAWTSALGRSLCDEIGLAHVVDPFVTRPIDKTSDAVRYFRLHGITGARHIYSDAELEELLRIVLACPNARTYVMFNNIPRVFDAQRFIDLASRVREGSV